MRIGIGEDIHRIDDARTLVLGGVIIEEGPGLAGHSEWACFSPSSALTARKVSGRPAI